MRIVIVGQQWMGTEVLRLCLHRGDDVIKVITPPAAGEEYDRLYAAAQQALVNVESVKGRINASHIPDNVDLIVAAHAHAFITAEARDKTVLGALSYHPSLLPRHRGRDSVRWAIHMCDPITGGTLYWMDDGADTGNIAAQEWCWVRPGDDARSLWRRDLAPIGLRLFESVLGDLDRGVITAIPQDHRIATWEPAFVAKRLSDSG